MLHPLLITSLAAILTGFVAMLVVLGCSGWMSRGPQLEKSNTIWPIDVTGAGERKNDDNKKYDRPIEIRTGRKQTRLSVWA